ncbi:MAG: ATP-binding protein [Aeromicrobium sp.]
MVRGVRSRTTVLATMIVFVMLALTGAALVQSQKHILTGAVDEVLTRQGAKIARDLEEGAPAKPIPGQGDDESFAQVLNSNGKIVAATATSPGDLSLPLPKGKSAKFRTLRPVDGDGDFRIRLQRHANRVILTATPLDDVNDSAATLAHGLLVAVPGATLLLAGLVWVIVGRVLQPVEDIRRQVAEISGKSLNRRVPDPHTRDEISRLSQTMNEMLERLEASAARQDRFVADASHELRSPLARIMAELEVDLAHPETADTGATYRSLLEETRSLQRLVDDLLLLARSDNADLSTRLEYVDLDDIVMREVQRLQATGRMAADTSGVSAAQVVGDPSHLARAVRNLLDNASQHGGSMITVALVEDSGEAVLSVCDDGPGIPAPMRERVFERFARIDEARASKTNGSGLGLAITREIVEALGGTIAVDPTLTPGARFVLRLPLAADHESRDGSDALRGPTTMAP